MMGSLVSIRPKRSPVISLITALRRHAQRFIGQPAEVTDKYHKFVYYYLPLKLIKSCEIADVRVELLNALGRTLASVPFTLDVAKVIDVHPTKDRLVVIRKDVKNHELSLDQSNLLIDYIHEYDFQIIVSHQENQILLYL